MMMMSGSCSSKFPFTAPQRQELENQALIFKYMASGHPIPPDLILYIRRSILMDSPPVSHFPLHPNIGLGCFQMGFGLKAEDPEPGRCRRTDGKKWRCSKKAYPDSKYCERHMHRGKNRSRKPVEMPLNTTITTKSNSNSSYSPYVSMAEAAATYPYSSHSRPPVMALSPETNPIHYHLGSRSSSSDRDRRYHHGFTETSGGGDGDGSWRFTPLGMSSLGEAKQNNHGCEGEEEEEKRNRHCFVLGTDFKLGRDAEEESEKQQPLRHFWSLKSKKTWMGMGLELEEDQSLSKTKLSISIPMDAHHDFHSRSKRDF